MTAAPKVSVLIPAYNVAGVLPRAVRSALDQTMGDLEVVVIDDASADGTSAAAEALAAEDRRVRILRAARNGGPGAARAIGLAAARGDWIAILDVDDSFRPNRLERLLREAVSRNLDVIADNLELIDPETDQFVTHAFPLVEGEAATITPERFMANSIPAGRVNLGWMQPVVRREFLERHAIAWRPLRHAEDLVFAMELLLAGARFALIGWSGYAYTQRRGTISGKLSAHSRTRRSAAEQHRALDELMRRCGEKMDAELRNRIARLRREIVVASHLLDARDLAGERRWLQAALAAAAAMADPRALSTCLLARYGPDARKLR